METSEGENIGQRWARGRDLAALVVSWGLWAVLTAGLFLYVRHYSRNIPFSDEFEIVPAMTGVQPMTISWLWAQHNEHRPMIPRLIMAELFRYVSTDFRLPRYVNAALLSAMAACMLLAVRRVRGSARFVDAVLPLAILNIAQGESLLNGFAMSLILCSAITIVTIAVMGVARGGDGRAIALVLGFALVLLPLCGGSGLAMLPPLILWLAGYLAKRWWSGLRPPAWVRAAGLVLLLAGTVVIALYLRGYSRPAHHPLPPSARAVASSALKCLSLAVYPSMSGDVRPAALLLAILVLATLLLLAIVSLRSPGERPRALGLMAIILAMLDVAAVVGYSRAGFGPAAGLASRYVSLVTPLLCALYMAWLAYGTTAARVGVHMLLLAMIVLSLPGGQRHARWYGNYVHAAERRVERSLLAHVPKATLMSRACPVLYPDPGVTYGYFKMLESARVGAFTELENKRVATAPPGGSIVR